MQLLQAGNNIFVSFISVLLWLTNPIFKLLERREQQMDDGCQKPLLVQFYEELRKHMEKGLELVPTFLKMFDSLRYVNLFQQLKSCLVINFLNIEVKENQLII